MKRSVEHLSSATEHLREIVFLWSPRGSSFRKAQKHTGGAVGRKGDKLICRQGKQVSWAMSLASFKGTKFT